MSEKTITITQSQLAAIDEMLECLFSQRSSYDSDCGTDNEVIDKGTRAIARLKKELAKLKMDENKQRT